MTRVPSFPFTPADLTRSREEIIEQFPDADMLMIDYAVANDIIINIFGPDCWGTRLVGAKPDAYFATRDGDGDGDGDGGDDDDDDDDDDDLHAYIHQSRVLGLAHDLLICQHFDGFAAQRQEMSKQSIMAVHHELRVARMLHDSGHTVAFVIPSGVKGADYDLVVDDVLATEAKAKEGTTVYSKSSLKNTLSTARRQLPQQGPGLVVLRIPDAWGKDRAFVEEAEKVFDGVLRSSSRINAILVLWDEWFQGDPEGAACLTRFRIFENAQPKTDFADLPRVLRSLAVDGSLENADMELPAGDWTLVCAVRRHGGVGPLFETFDGDLQMIFDRGGFVANRVAGQIRVTALPLSAVNGLWVNIMLRFGPSGVDLRVDDTIIDSWSAVPQDYTGFRMMPGVDADLRDTLVYSTPVADEDVDQLFSHLSAKAAGPYVQFRRGDLARFRTGPII